MSAETYVPDIPDQPMPDAQRAGAGGRCKDTWDVKSLLAKKVVRGKEEFIVEWEGFPKGGDIKGGPKGGPSWTEGAQFREQSVLAGTLNQFERSHESATRPHLFGTSSVFVAPTGVIGTGLFASVDFTSGDEVGRLLQYGVVPDNVVPPESEGYNFAVPGRPGLSIMPYPLKKSWHGWQEDALVHANHASTPNAELVYRKGVCAEMPLIKLVAIADIGEGYEIRFSYEADDVGGYGASAEETTVEEYWKRLAASGQWVGAAPEDEPDWELYEVPRSLRPQPSLELGMRVAIPFDHPEKWYDGNIATNSKGLFEKITTKGRVLHFVKFDDGDKDWRDFGDTRWRLVDAAPLAWDGPGGGDERLEVIVPPFLIYAESCEVSANINIFHLVATHLHGRTADECEARWHMLEQRLAAVERRFGITPPEGSAIDERIITLDDAFLPAGARAPVCTAMVRLSGYLAADVRVAGAVWRSGQTEWPHSRHRSTLGQDNARSTLGQVVEGDVRVHLAIGAHVLPFRVPIRSVDLELLVDWRIARGDIVVKQLLEAEEQCRQHTATAIETIMEDRDEVSRARRMEVLVESLRGVGIGS